MQWTVYWDRPQNLINEYISSIEGFISFAFPNWGSQNRGVHAKGEYGMGSLRADHMGLLDTQKADGLYLLTELMEQPTLDNLAVQHPPL